MAEERRKPDTEEDDFWYPFGDEPSNVADQGKLQEDDFWYPFGDAEEAQPAPETPETPEPALDLDSFTQAPAYDAPERPEGVLFPQALPLWVPEDKSYTWSYTNAYGTTYFWNEEGQRVEGDDNKAKAWSRAKMSLGGERPTWWTPEEEQDATEFLHKTASEMGIETTADNKHKDFNALVREVFQANAPDEATFNAYLA